MTSREIAKIAHDVIDEKQGENIKVIDISNVSIIADYFLIASANNVNQLQAISDAVQEQLAKSGVHIKQIEGNRNATWVLLDYGDVVIHLFDKEDRFFYNLERIWMDGKVVEDI
ncbi:ribosome silencing factor [Bacteroides heparinolyticus]|uniref:ribosome silencing factor n=1 Tax=Prevotella heparinolytica TaxID=28113 RepID=UPI0035A0BAA7